MYVLFLKDHLGAEHYATRTHWGYREKGGEVIGRFRQPHNEVITTPDLSDALAFESARMAYEFGAGNKLEDMRVGYRVGAGAKSVA